MITPNEFKALRISKGFTQKDLAEMVGTTQTTITNIEKGVTKNPSVDIALNIANALGEDVYFLFGEETMKAPSTIVTENEIERLKELLFGSLEMYVSNQVFFKAMQYNEGEGNEEFNDYRQMLSEFKKGTLQTLINVGFCTVEEMRLFYDKINPNINKPI